MVDWLAAQGIEGATVLEIGGGVGQVQLELLRRGAARATNLELSPAYDEEASVLAAESGLEDRIARRLGDIAVDPSLADPHDVVVLNRVVCCYPDAERLLAAAAEHARRAIVFSHPPRNVASQALLGVERLGLMLMRQEYRTFAHPPEMMRTVLRDHGFVTGRVPNRSVWQITTATRA